MIESLSEKWLRSGISPGDTVLLHSNIQRTLIAARRSGLRIGPVEILNSFMDVIGFDGNLLIPLFNFDYAKGNSFDIRTSPSQMGSLTEAARLHKGVIRTGHPIYSFGVIGANAREFKNIDNYSAYAEDSPFGIIKRLDGKIAVLDLEDQQSMTFYHHIEEIKKVDYRYFKAFRGQYTGWSGEGEERSYAVYVRDLDRGVVTNVNPAGELLWQAGLYKGYRPKVDTGLRVIRATEMFGFIAKLIDAGKALDTLYSIRS